MSSNSKINQLELKISHFLRMGVLVSAIFMAIGWSAYTFSHSVDYSHLAQYQHESFLTTFNSALSTNSWGTIISYVGLFILIALPIIRVLLTGILFVKEKDYVLGAIAFFVLFTLALSFYLGFEI